MADVQPANAAVGLPVVDPRALLAVIDFFIPAEVLSAVLLVFTMENILDHAFEAFIPSGFQGIGWVAVYILGILAISGMNYITADDDELSELTDDIKDL